MSKLLVSQLVEDQEVVGFFIVRGKQLRTFRGRPGGFLVLQLGDKSGEIEAKVWDDAEQWHRQLKTEMVVKVSGRTQVFNGRLEMNLTRIRVARDDEFSLDDFLPVSLRDRGEMLEELRAVVSEIRNPHLATLLDKVFDSQMRRDFASAPGAKVIHHAFIGGLLQHTLEVVKLCRTALDLYPGADADLLIAGAVLHDIGKVKEYTFQRSIDFSDEGRLIGHIVLGEDLLVERARQIPSFPDDLLLRLRHMLLSHHGMYEWQSPKRPKTIEACILHQADYFSGQVAIFDNAIKTNADPDAAWTDYNKILNRAVFVGTATPPNPLYDDTATVRRLMEEPYQGY